MKKWILVSLGLLLGIFLATQAAAQEQKAKESADRLSGRVQMVSKDTSQITLVTKNSVKRTVVYSPQTKFTVLNKPGTLDEVKDGKRVICLGKFNDKGQLVASRIDVRAN